MVKYWIKAMRLRTLPLALSGILVGSFASWQNGFNWPLFCALCLTATCLQILSNFANDYGDFVKGTDNETRIGEKRMVSSGFISALAMKRGIILMSLLSFIAGSWLLWLSKLNATTLALFFGIGILAIVAAITYTVGKRAYGYSALGDLSVFIFFGIISVAGCSFLMTRDFDTTIILPAAAMGMLAMAVLNLNNMRDLEGDLLNGKYTLANQLGFQKAKIYHQFLLSSPILLLCIYFGLRYISNWQFLFLLSTPILIKLSKTVHLNTQPKELDGELKKQALTTLLIAILFSLGMVLS